MLAGLGFYSGPRTQEFDKKLHEAIATFQAKHKLPRSGMCQPETFQYELDALCGTPPPAGVRPAAESEVIQRAHASKCHTNLRSEIGIDVRRIDPL
jgi:peptidoglycan hydrolase-like protein with peptidoglycan-binding domain